MVLVLTDEYSNFYPRPPRGGRPGTIPAIPPPDRFLSTPSARRATTPLCSRSAFLSISIHALREEGDLLIQRHRGAVFQFLSTPSARRATQDHARLRAVGEVFLSTPSARRATRPTRVPLILPI